jgi:hypothetical protein
VDRQADKHTDRGKKTGKLVDRQAGKQNSTTVRGSSQTDKNRGVDRQTGKTADR